MESWEDGGCGASTSLGEICLGYVATCSMHVTMAQPNQCPLLRQILVCPPPPSWKKKRMRSNDRMAASKARPGIA
jgi:hypothetical protein